MQALETADSGTRASTGRNAGRLQSRPDLLTESLLQSEPPRHVSRASRDLEGHLTVHGGLFFLTVSWASIFGVWSGLFAGVYCLFLCGVRSGGFFRSLDQFSVWRRG